MPGFLKAKALEEALGRLERYWKPRPRAIKVPLADASDLVLAEDVISNLDIPPFDRAAFDGYAVHASDTYGAGEDSPVPLKCIGRLPAGTWSSVKLRAGQCLEIATGAPLPNGADAVVMVEYAVARKDVVDIYRAVAPGENVAERGSEVGRGTKVLRTGQHLHRCRTQAPRLKAQTRSDLRCKRADDMYGDRGMRRRS